MARKPNLISKEEIHQLSTLIKEKGSIPIVHAVDCKQLSYHVHTITGKNLSESTLKRFFGFSKNEFSPSYDTVRILKQYVTQHIQSAKVSDAASLVLDFFNPLHFEQISTADNSFRAACRSIALSLKKDTLLLEQVMEPLAGSAYGRRFYYDLFADYELLPKVQKKGYALYLQHEKTYEGKMFAHCILFLCGFFENNHDLMKDKWKTISALYQPKSKLHPFVLGRYFQTQLMAHHLFKPAETKKIIDDVFKIEKKMPRNEAGNFKEFPGFHYFVCDGLWHIGAYDQLLKMSAIALMEFRKYKEFTWKGYYDQLYLYRALALIRLGKSKQAQQLSTRIQPERFYFPTKNYFDQLYREFVDHRDQ